MEATSDGSTPPAGTTASTAELEAEIRNLRARLRATERARDLAVAEIERCEARLARARALADLADWADSTEGDGRGDPTVRVSELRHALR